MVADCKEAPDEQARKARAVTTADEGTSDHAGAEDTGLRSSCIGSEGAADVGDGGAAAAARVSRSERKSVSESYEDDDGNDLEAHHQLLDYELYAVRKMRRAFSTTLRMMEATRDDLIEMGKRIDRLAAASQACRQALRAKQETWPCKES